jgi:hypothetical protein
MDIFSPSTLAGDTKNFFHLDPHPLSAVLVKYVNNGKSNLKKNMTEIC